MGNMIFKDYGPMLFDSIALAPKDTQKEYKNRMKKHISNSRREEEIRRVRKELREEDFFIDW